MSSESASAEPHPAANAPEVPSGVRAWFERARVAGLLGSADVDDHIAHADRFRRVVAPARGGLEGRALDLGTGAGLPGLVLACWWPRSSWVLVDGKQKRAAMLRQAVDELSVDLGWSDRVEVRCGRAEALARESMWREAFDVVVARSFGPPAVVAECATGFLRVGGRLAVSEPPPPAESHKAGGGTLSPSVRWEGAPVGELGLAVGACASSIQLLEKIEVTPLKYPRRIGMPAKRPIF